jgi:hypothetical protein
MAANEAAKEAAWLEKVSMDLGEYHDNGNEQEPIIEPPVLRIDNQAAIELIENPRFHAKAKHIDIRICFIQNDMVNNSRLRIEHIPGINQPADILTKQLGAPEFRRLIQRYGISD